MWEEDPSYTNCLVKTCLQLVETVNNDRFVELYKVKAAGSALDVAS